MIELIDFCLNNNIQPEVLIPDNHKAGDNIKEEHYDEYLRKRGVKVYRVPVFHKRYNASMFQLVYWRLRLKFSGLFYNSVHIINLNLADRLYEIVKNKNRYFWHIINRIQWEGKKYPYRQILVSKPNDSIVTVNKYQLIEMQDHFKSISCKVLPFKLFLNS